MAGAYSNGLNQMAQGAILWKASGGSTVKAQLTVSTYALDKEAHDNLSDVSASKVSGTTDQTVALSDPAEDATNNQVELDSSAASVTYSAVASGTTGEVIVYKDSGVAGTSTLISYNDFSGGDITANGSDITVTWNADGILALVYGA